MNSRARVVAAGAVIAMLAAAAGPLRKIVGSAQNGDGNE